MATSDPWAAFTNKAASSFLSDRPDSSDQEHYLIVYAAVTSDEQRHAIAVRRPVTLSDLQPVCVRVPREGSLRDAVARALQGTDLAALGVANFATRFLQQGMRYRPNEAVALFMTHDTRHHFEAADVASRSVHWVLMTADGLEVLPSPYPAKALGLQFAAFHASASCLQAPGGSIVVVAYAPTLATMQTGRRSVGHLPAYISRGSPGVPFPVDKAMEALAITELQQDANKRKVVRRCIERHATYDKPNASTVLVITAEDGAGMMVADDYPAGRQRCNHCKADGVKHLCAACKSTYYCNETCQLADWPAHKRSCKRLQAAITNELEARTGMLRVED
ncbi:SET domain and MYND-type zinc finger protein 6 [Tetrabaena socialis]|uniref:SET domain and MYND-type zinc finger protein 6 n=1 Tax=Tetrabaena socialis TaxID=47790 RepID=A0A2J7ZMK0_9CHLO|nr:SET domain and MYND-type zinc finger protein 6 [Tetrabaena socialis]|eukprot:PNH01493.1 SET domain and MYND-type zinc finger protein 6 [Tetrabaena socialis]